MKFESKLVRGTLIKRYKRFFADVTLDKGDIVISHCPNTGSMTGCAIPDSTVYLLPNNNPKRKLKYTWEIVVNGQNEWIGVNTGRANKLVEEALLQKLIPEFTEYSQIRREVKYGHENSRIDLLLSADTLPLCYIEVKSVTLKAEGKGYFPDAVTERGQKHLRELMTIAASGHRAVLLFCVQHTGIKTVSPAEHIDPKYAALCKQAVRAGVEIMAWGATITEEKIELNHKLQVEI